MNYKKIKNISFLILIILSPILSCSAYKNKNTIVRKIRVDGEKKSKKVRKQVVSLNFFLTKEEVIETLAPLPPTVQTRIRNDLKSFLEDIEGLLFLPPEFLWLVDKNQPIPNAQYYIPKDLINLTLFPKIPISRKDHQVREIIINDLETMIKDANKEGLHLVVSSAYRSYDYQINLFKRWTNELGIEKAKQISAREGTSQHQLGTTIDFNSITEAFAETDEGKWIYENGWKYGFSLSYPKGIEKLTGYDWEPWHWRYIGKNATVVERRWFNGIQQNFLKWWHENSESLEKNYIPIEERKKK